MGKLVEQTLDPMVAAHFKNTGQTKKLLDLLHDRASIESQALSDMGERLKDYSLNLQEVLIGTPRPAKNDNSVEFLLQTLRDRQVAEQEQMTFKVQEETAKQQRSLKEAQAIAEMQPQITQSALGVTVAENQGSASVKAAQKEAEKIVALANANAVKLRAEGDGEAAKVRAIGLANAEAAKAQVEAYGGPEIRLAQEIFDSFFEAVREGKQALVPQILVAGSDQDGGLIPSNALKGVIAALLPKLTNLAPPTVHTNGAIPPSA